MIQDSNFVRSDGFDEPLNFAVDRTVLLFIGMKLNEQGDLVFFKRFCRFAETEGQVQDAEVISKIKEYWNEMTERAELIKGVEETALDFDLDCDKKVEMIFHLAFSGWEFRDDMIKLKEGHTHDDVFRGLKSKSLGPYRDKQTIYLYNRNDLIKRYQLDLHIAIKQRIDDRIVSTPIIIDPGVGNDGSGGHGGDKKCKKQGW